jgi:hypothetical protein
MTFHLPIAEPPLGYWIAYLVLTLALGLWAHWWGRNPWAWAGIALLLTPVIAAIGLLVKGQRRTQS